MEEDDNIEGAGMSSSPFGFGNEGGGEGGACECWLRCSYSSSKPDRAWRYFSSVLGILPMVRVDIMWRGDRPSNNC